MLSADSGAEEAAVANAVGEEAAAGHAAVDDAREAYVENVLEAVEAIPPGRVVSYGDIAAAVGRGGPRQVGAVLRWHGGAVCWWRVLRADGRPARHLGERQLDRLRAEGVLARNGRVGMRQHRHQLQADD